MATRAGLGYVSPPRTIDHTTCILNNADTGTPETHRYYLARRTVLEMLKDRGCEVDESQLTRSVTEFREVVGDVAEGGVGIGIDKLRVCVPLVSNPWKKIVVVFAGPEEVNKAKATHILMSILNKDSLHRIIVIMEGKMNHYARKEFDSCAVKVETFPITELFVNITKHVTMPKHETLTAQEKEQLLVKFKIDENQIPHMLESDAIARYYGLEKKQVVKISYNSKMTGSFVTYRCVR
ncbi:DNA-directed RNA polymerase V subunit 5C-like [Bidens hawaiensis]|uniref:DNA-directed RNA polymerase V subunit 5C-like n=1 Tax=Bidens hawaiensis TaxID=980011 RepID=UPI0040492D25